MTLHKKQTEKLILDTAKRIFFQEGNLKATTQEIADAAQVNRTLVHYYFRSRDILFQEVFLEGKRELRKNLSDVFEENIPFRHKIEKFIDTYNLYISTYPYQEIFLMNAVNCKDPLLDLSFASIREIEGMRRFLAEIQAEVDKGTIKKMEPEMFVVNLFALLSYPMMMKPLYCKMFSISMEELQQKFINRKAIIMDLVFN